MIAEHYNAVYAMLPAGLQKYKGGVPTEAVYPYVCLWGDPGNEVSETLCDTPDDLVVDIRCTYAGLTFDSVLVTAKRVRAALNRKAPIVAGWSPQPMRQAPLQNVADDPSVTIPNFGHPFFAVDSFALMSTKA